MAWAERVLALLFRQRCVGCAAWGPAPACDTCLAAWPRPLGGTTPVGVSAVVAGAAYAGVARGAVKALKLEGRPGVAPLLAAPLAAHPALPDAGWLLVPVPLHPGRRRRRGYNQAKLIARAIARLSGHRVADVLRRTRATGRQTKLGRAARAANLDGAVACRRDLTGARCILVDDVLTTGATAEACARALRAAGAADVVVAAATWTPAPRRRS